MAMNGTPKAGGSGFKMNPGSKQVDSPSTFRQDSPLKALGMNPGMAQPGAMGASPAMKTEKKGSSKAKRGPQTKNIGGVRVSYSTKGRSEKNTDLLEVGKKYYNKAKKYIKNKMK